MIFRTKPPWLVRWCSHIFINLSYITRFSYDFPMIFRWFSYVFPRIFPWLSLDLDGFGISQRDSPRLISQASANLRHRRWEMDATLRAGCWLTEALSMSPKSRKGIDGIGHLPANMGGLLTLEWIKQRHMQMRGFINMNQSTFWWIDQAQ